MDALDRRACVDEVTERRIGNAAYQLLRGRLFTLSERKDIEQDLRLECLMSLKTFDPARGSVQAFLKRVIENRAATLVEHRKAARRDPRRVAFSLDESIENHEGEITLREEAIGPEHLHSDVQLRMVQDHDLRVEVGRFIYRLPPRHRDLCLRLMDQTVTEISIETGIRRGTIYGCLARIRAAAKEAGLSDYM